MADDGLKRVGIVFKADGSVNFTKSLKEVNTAVNENRSAFKLMKSEWNENTTAMQKLRDTQEYLTQQTESYSEKVRQLEEILKSQENEEKRNESAISKTKEQLNNAKAALNNYEKGLKDVSSQIKSGSAQLEEYAKKIQGVADKSTAAGKTLSKGITAPIVATGTAAAVAWKQVDEAYDNIAAGTGATGEQLEGLKNSFDNVFSSVPASAENVSTSIADINTRFGFTGDELESCSKKFLEFSRVNNADVSISIQDVSRYMGDAGIQSSDYASVLDSLTAASQASGLSIDRLSENLTKYGAPMRALGLSTQESIALFSQWEKAGVNTEIAFSGMKKAISNWGSAGKDASVEFKKTLEQIAAAPDIASATSKAIEVFGAKAGPDLADAIQGGRFSIEEFMKTVEGSGGQLDASFKEMQSGPEQAKVAMHDLTLAGSSLAESAITTFGPALTECVKKIKEFTEWFRNLDSGQKNFIMTIALVAAAVGPALIAFGKMAAGISNIVKAGSDIAKITPKVMELGKSFASSAGEVGKFAKQIALSTANLVKNAAQIAASIIKLAAHKVATIASTAATKAMEVAQGALNLIMSLNPITLIIIGITALIAALVLLYNRCEGFRNAVNAGVKIVLAFVNDAVEKAKGFFNSIIDFIKNNWQGLLLFIVNPFAGAFKLLYDNCSGFKSFIDGIVEGIKEAWGTITQPFKDAVNGIKEAWGWLKDAIKLPHFSIEGSFSLTPPSTPHLGVEWYANGGILNSPTIFGMNGGSLMGGGEAGPEAVLPISNLIQYMRQANFESNSQLVSALSQVLPAAIMQALSGIDGQPLFNIYFDGKKLTKEMAEQVMKIITRKQNNNLAMKGES